MHAYLLVKLMLHASRWSTEKLELDHGTKSERGYLWWSLIWHHVVIAKCSLAGQTLLPKEGERVLYYAVVLLECSLSSSGAQIKPTLQDQCTATNPQLIVPLVPCGKCSVVGYVNWGPQNMTVGQNVVHSNKVAQYNCIVQLSLDSFSLFG